MIAEDNYPTFGYVWFHVGVDFFREEENRGDGPGGTLFSKLFLLLDMYGLPCSRNAYSAILLLVSVYPFLVNG